jgi:hypothetical protein
MTIDQRPAQADEWTPVEHVRDALMSHQSRDRAPAIEPRTRALWEGLRQGMLMMVDGIERFLGIEPRTAELRKNKR